MGVVERRHQRRRHRAVILDHGGRDGLEAARAGHALGDAPSFDLVEVSRRRRSNIVRH
jgi:hypothetical protein